MLDFLWYVMSAFLIHAVVEFYTPTQLFFKVIRGNQSVYSFIKSCLTQHILEHYIAVLQWPSAQTRANCVASKSHLPRPSYSVYI